MRLLDFCGFFLPSFSQSCLPTPAGQLVAVLLINCELHSLHQMGRTDRIGGGGDSGRGDFEGGGGSGEGGFRKEELLRVRTILRRKRRNLGRKREQKEFGRGKVI